MPKTINYNIKSLYYKTHFYYKIVYSNDEKYYKKYCYDQNHKLIYRFIFDRNDNIIDAKLYPHTFLPINNKNQSLNMVLKYGTSGYNRYMHLKNNNTHNNNNNNLLQVNMLSSFPNLLNCKIFFHKFKSYNINNIEYFIDALYCKNNGVIEKINSIKYINNELYSYKLYNNSNNTKIITYY